METRRARATLGSRIVETGGRTTGFDYLRIGLAVAVVLWHTIATSYGKPVADAFLATPFRPVVAFILPAFFALSGFLVAGSLERNRSLFRFGALRVLRIVPALAVEVTLSALILGPTLTALPLSTYFSSPVFAHYFLNVVGDIHYYLPGLFLSNPMPAVVNGQLWTIPFEFQCYGVLAGLAALGVARRRWMLMAALLTVQVYSVVHYVQTTPLPWGRFDQAVRGHYLVFAFLAGVIIYRLRDLIPFNRGMFIVAALLSILLLDLPMGDIVLALPICYAIAYLGLQNPRANFIVKFGDLSYGVFLYGFAVQQVVARFGPWAHHWYINAVLSLTATTGIAFLSWNLIEKPALGLRRYLSVFDAIDASISSGQARLGGWMGRSGIASMLAEHPVAVRLLRAS